MRVVGLVSCYREGNLVNGAIESLLAACDQVHVLEARIEDAGSGGDESVFPKHPKVLVRQPPKTFESDAAKRTALVEWANGRTLRPDWFVVLDGDELLLWGEYLRDWITRCASESDTPLAVGLRVVEMDASVAMIPARVLRAPMIERYVTSSHVIELINGQVVTLPNEPLCGAGGLPLPPPQLREPSSARLKIVSPDSGMPIQTADAISPLELAQHLTRFRSPVHGEAHILHRSALRAKDRQVERQHVAEARALGLDGQ